LEILSQGRGNHAPTASRKVLTMPPAYQPLTPEQEAAVRAIIIENPFIAFLGIEVPDLGLGYAQLYF
jgi:hypothetical protein